ncbi:hypothetical protein KKF84_08550, partial [Myxococcota bacterium]|nr:hypothetical protein [Myxococcota bacterium]
TLYLPIIWGLFAFALTSCGSRSDLGGWGNYQTPDGGTDGDVINPPWCNYDNRDLAMENLVAADRLGLGVSQSVVEGVVSALNADGFHLVIDRVWHGVQPLEGIEVNVPVETAGYSEISVGTRLVAGFRGNALPALMDAEELPVWWGLTALIPKARSDASLLGFMSYNIPVVATVRLIQKDSDHLVFEVDEVMKGECPAAFQVSRSSYGGFIPWPEPSDTPFIAAFTDIPSGGPGLPYAGLAHFAPADAVSLSELETELATPKTYWDYHNGPLGADYAEAFAYHLAPHIYRTEVTGISGECCTGAGGTFIMHNVTSYLKGEDPATSIISGGHAYYGSETCGDPMIFASHSMGSLEDFSTDDFDCTGSLSTSISEITYDFLPLYLRSMPDSEENRAKVLQWLGYPAPLLLVRSEEDQSPDAAFDPARSSGYFGAPLSLDRAISASPYTALITVEEVTTSGDRHEVVLSTTFHDQVYEDDVVYRIKVAFSCGDPRLLVQGASYLGIFLVAPHLYLQQIVPQDYGSLFLIPGVLLPNLPHLRQTLQYSAYEYL